ncbi:MULTISPECIES: ABC transporter ATP-binding protein [unclassified Oceanispirochaeta]|uniref:ABC transporter ATP-binding protein n=1 Tax=unclassified Oceanispirochaeta TaxID=2635722 RepID=UPI000E093CD0|nr:MULTISPECIES: ABC transporter ATP-binding protein [unclassified Oceanispirochaeta]MBF9017328.1 ABC transporter ATP-binding protein [Oceanispirochaeta sp. M2]NPD73838.1 ABC transporter ATP-binding protein [Oceanispirochaeta sp. M1]RDG30438.1 ABC transporter ATP-binding protein [Oceanispirochaeta sp. M1]
MGITVENVTKTHQGYNILDNVNLVVNDGDFSVLLAPTGSGKTTLLKIIAGIEKPTSGKIYYDGVDVTNMSVQQRNIAMVYQQFVNYPSFTIYENIASPLRVSKIKYTEKEIDERVRANAELLGISHILDHLPEQISGGQQQRTALARALAKGTKYVFLDEPLANLDYKLREELRGELKLIFGKKGGSIIYATPEPIDAMGMASHVGFVHEGKIMQYGPVKEVYKNPKYLEVGEYFSNPTMNILEGKKVDENGRQYIKVTEEFKIDVSKIHNKLPNDSYYLGIHAHDISLTRKKDSFVEIDGFVELTEAVGSDTEIHIEHGGKNIISLVQDIISYDIGEAIKIYVDPERFYLFDKNTHELSAKTWSE